MTEFLDSYLTATRLQNRGAATPSWYLQVLESAGVGPDELNAAQLRVVYSMQRRTEVIVPPTGVPVLIYDQYLAQSLNTLNRILLESDDGLQASMYFAKCVGEELTLRGYFGAALVAFALHVALKEEHPLPTRLSPLRGTIGYLQEVFVVSHERAHHGLGRGAARPAMEAFGDLILDEGLSVRGEQVVAEVAEGLLRRYGVVVDPQDIVDSRDSMLQQWEGMRELCREELVCDAVAAGRVAQTCAAKGIDKVVGAMASFLALRQLRFFMYVRAAVRARIAAGRFSSLWEADTTDILQSQMREHLLRDWLPAIFALREDESRTLREQLSAVSDRSDRRIEYVALTHAVPMLDELYKPDDLLSAQPLQGRSASLTSVAELTGWKF